MCKITDFSTNYVRLETLINTIVLISHFFYLILQKTIDK